MKYAVLSNILISISILICAGCNLAKSNSNERFGEIPKMRDAIIQQDTLEIQSLLESQYCSLNYRDAKFGSTLLMFSIRQRCENSFNTLLRCGADPNIFEYSGNQSAFTLAAGLFDSSNYLKSIVEGDFYIKNNTQKDDSTLLWCPMIEACRTNLKNVLILSPRILDIDFTLPDGNFPLREACIASKSDIAFYLIFSLHANPLRKFGTDMDGNDRNISDYLRKWTFEIGSMEHQRKMEIVDYLRTQGVEYRDSKIPKHYFDIYDREYLDKY